MSIQFFNNGLPVNLRERRKLKAYLADLFISEGFNLDNIQYIFCTDTYLLNINREYLNHDTYTDIITFPMSIKGEPIVGEIYISIDRVKDNAKFYKNSFNRELLRVIFHGALHLCGYKDKTVRQIKIMRAKEDYYISKYLED